MKKIIDAGFGRKTLYEMSNSSRISSKWQYGLAELSQKYHIEHISWKQFNFIGNIVNNFNMLRSCDVLFQSYLYVKPVYLLAILKRLSFYRKRKLIGVSHTNLRTKQGIWSNWMLRIVYNSFDKILFHSKQNMAVSIDKGLIKPEKCEYLYWGEDLDYIDKNININQGNFFLSTGRECRDFPTLISAFSKTPNIPLEIYTNKINYGNKYDYLEKEQEKFPNINIEFVEKSTETTRFLAQKVGECLCVVIPLRQEDIYYCLGLTSVVEAMAMGKPIISTRNPYSPVDIEKEKIGFFVDDEQSWINAINYIFNNPNAANEMGQRAQKLAKEKFNITKCAQQIDRIIDEYY